MANAYEVAVKVQDTLQMYLRPNTGILSYANRKYQGTLQQSGDTVTIEELPASTWGNRAADKAADFTRSDWTATSYDIAVSQDKVINHRVAKLEEIQASFDVRGGLLDRVAQGLLELQETHFLAQLATDAGNTVTTAALDATTIFSKFIDMKVALDADKAPTMWRIAVVDPTVAGVLLNAGIWVYTDDGMDEIRQGYNPTLAGFKIYMTTLWPANTILGFCDGMSHFVEQLSEIQVNKLPENDGYAIIGASAYQAKTVGTHVNTIVKHIYT